MTDKPTISLQAAARAVAVDYAGSSDEDPNVTEYMLRMADRIDELEEALDSKHASVGHNIWRFWSDKAREIAKKLDEARSRIERLEVNISLKETFIDATINDSAADLQTIHIAKTTLEDIAAGRGMFGLVAEEDLKWAMNLAGKTAEVIEERIKK